MSVPVLSLILFFLLCAGLFRFMLLKRRTFRAAAALLLCAACSLLIPGDPALADSAEEINEEFQKFWVDEIILYDDINANVDLVCNDHDVTFDLNGYTIWFYEEHGLRVSGGVTLKLIDSSLEETGMIKTFGEYGIGVLISGTDSAFEMAGGTISGFRWGGVNADDGSKVITLLPNRAIYLLMFQTIRPVPPVYSSEHSDLPACFAEHPHQKHLPLKL